MKERCDALKSAHEAVIERGQAEELQMQHDEQAAQAKWAKYAKAGRIAFLEISHFILSVYETSTVWQTCLRLNVPFVKSSTAEHG